MEQIEIKFRGLRDDSWIYGMTISKGVVATDDNIYFQTSKHEWKRVDKKTVGQYINLKDKHGVEIYEGDIVEQIVLDGYDYGCKGVVVFKNGRFGLKTSSSDRWGLTSFELTSEWRDGNASGTAHFEYKVIGNIYDNPNLLTTK